MKIKQPFNHALLHTLASFAIGALIIASQEALTLLSQVGSLNYLTVLKEVAFVFLFALAKGLFRYVEASNDPVYKTAAGVADQRLSNVEKKVLPDVKDPVPAAQNVLDMPAQITQVTPAANPTAQAPSDWMKAVSNEPA